MAVTTSKTLYARVETASCFLVEPIAIQFNEEQGIQLPKQFACMGDTIELSSTLTITTTGTYEVEDRETCITTTYNYEFEDCSQICTPQLPTAFTPNNDGVNDVFNMMTPEVGNCSIQLIDMQVYNRWGDVVYAGNSSWNGKNGSDFAQTGAYVYQIRYSATSDYGTIEQATISGVVNLLR